jgi:hypothetical protein
MITHQLQATTDPNNEAPPAVSIYKCNTRLCESLDEVTKAVDELTKFAEADGGHLYILTDEANFDRD